MAKARALARAERERVAAEQAARRQAEVVVALLFVVNVLVWFAAPSPSARALAIVASVLVAPVLYTVLFRRD